MTDADPAAKPPPDPVPWRDPGLCGLGGHMGNVDDGQIPDRGSVTRDQALAMWRREFGYRSTDIPMSDNQLRRYGYDPDKATRS